MPSNIQYMILLYNAWTASTTTHQQTKNWTEKKKKKIIFRCLFSHHFITLFFFCFFIIIIRCWFCFSFSICHIYISGGCFFGLKIFNFMKNVNSTNEYKVMLQMRLCLQMCEHVFKYMCDNIVVAEPFQYLLCLYLYILYAQ